MTRLPELSRRGFMVLASTSVSALWLDRVWAGPDSEHLLLVRVPEFTTNKAKVPIVVEMAHPMTPDHFITKVEVVNASDKSPAKGTFHFTPANGGVYLAFQAQMDPGTSEVLVVAECNRHGRSSSTHKIQVDDGGGCAGGEPAVRRTDGDDIHPPVIRIAELVQEGRLKKGELVHAQVKLRHPNRRAAEPLYLERLEAYLGDEPAGRFELTAALSDDPFITFGLVARRQKDLRVVLVNNRGERLEARHEIRFA
jgi:desulfoferrodoxin (superoxide reductase-like protein)